MGVLRGFGIVIISVLLFVFLLAAGIFGTLTTSLTYENVQPKVHDIASEIVTTQIGTNNIVNQITPYLELYCQNSTEIVQKFGNYTFVFPCDVVSQGQDEIVNYTVDYLVNDFYYKDYNCTFTKCFQESPIPLFLVSDQARVYWRNLFYKSLIGILILLGLIFLFVEKKSNALILPGILMIASSLIVSQLKTIGSFIAKLILSPIFSALSETPLSKDIITNIVRMFFSESTRMFLWMFITGIIFIIVGIIFRITGLGVKIQQKMERLKNKDKIEELEEKTKSLEKQLKQKNSNPKQKDNSNKNLKK